MKTEKLEFVYATFIRTTPEKLWEALKSGEFSQKYWMGFRVEVELKAGGVIRIHPPPGMEQHGEHKGEVLVCEPNRKLVYTRNRTTRRRLRRSAMVFRASLTSSRRWARR